MTEQQKSFQRYTRSITQHLIPQVYGIITDSYDSKTDILTIIIDNKGQKFIFKYHKMKDNFHTKSTTELTNELIMCYKKAIYKSFFK